MKPILLRNEHSLREAASRRLEQLACNNVTMARLMDALIFQTELSSISKQTTPRIKSSFAAWIVALSFVYTILGKAISVTLDTPDAIFSPRILAVIIATAAAFFAGIEAIERKKNRHKPRRIAPVITILVILNSLFSIILLLSGLFTNVGLSGTDRIFDGVYFLVITGSITYLASIALRASHGKPAPVFMLLVRASYISTLGITGMLVLLAVSQNVAIPEGVRSFVGRELQPIGFGTNYIALSLVFLSIFPFLSMNGALQSSIRTRILSLISLMVSFTFILLLGSRQASGGMLLIAVGTPILHSFSKGFLRLSSIIGAMFTIALLVGLTIGISLTPSGALIIERQLNPQEGGESVDVGRLSIYRGALDLALANPLVGNGPNSSKHYTGHDPHNTWLLYASDAGIFAPILLFAQFAVIFVAGFATLFRLRSIGDWRNLHLLLGLLTSLATIIVWSTQFNIIQYRLELWILTGITLSFLLATSSRLRVGYAK